MCCGLLLGLNSLPVEAFSQEEVPTAWTVGANAHTGTLIAHRKGMEILVQEPASAWELSFTRHTTGKRLWERLYSGPSWGFALRHGSPGSPDYLGRTTAFYPFFRFRLAGQKRLLWHYRIGWGLGYISKNFERFDNFKNIAIGSKINAVINMQWDLEFLVTKKLSLQTGLAFTHFSNGSFKMPNLGINVPTATVGVHWTVGDRETQRQTFDVPEHEKHWEAYVFAAGGIKEVGSPLGQKWGTFTGSFEMLHAFSHKHALVFGADVFYNSSLEERIRIADDKEVSGVSLIRSGVKTMYHINLDRMAILMGGGVYLISPFDGDGNIFNRIGVRYRFTDRFVGNLTLKTHFFKADYIEWGLGYRLW